MAINTFQTRITALESASTNSGENVADIAGDISDIQGDISDIQGSITALDGRIDALEALIPATAGEITSDVSLASGKTLILYDSTDSKRYKLVSTAGALTLVEV